MWVERGLPHLTKTKQVWVERSGVGDFGFRALPWGLETLLAGHGGSRTLAGQIREQVSALSCSV